MTRTFALLTLAFGVAVAQEPARLLPDDALIFLEVQRPRDLMQGLWAEPWLQEGIAKIPAVVRTMVEAISKHPIDRMVIGVRTKGIFRSARWTAAVTAPDLEASLAVIRRALPMKFASRTEDGWLIVGSDEDAIERPEQGESLADVQGFRTYRSKHPNPRLGFHIDLARVLPVRPGLGDPKDLGAIFFLGHLLATAAKTPTLSGALEIDNGLHLKMWAPLCNWPPNYEFFEVPAEAAPLLDVRGAVARLSLSRNPELFWAAREQLAKPAEKEALARFQGQAETLLGELAYEDLLAALGSTVDVYAAPPAATEQSLPRFPEVAMVIPLRDEALADELILTFQSIIGVVNIDRGGKGQPRFLLESEEVGGMRIHVARHFAEHLAGPKDPRGQLRIALACAHGRFILGSHPAVVGSILNAIQSGHTRPRAHLDDLELDVATAQELLYTNLDILAARRALEEGGTVEQAKRDLGIYLGALSRFSQFSASVDIKDGQAELNIRLRSNPQPPPPGPK